VLSVPQKFSNFGPDNMVVWYHRNIPVHLVHDTFVLNIPVHLVHDTFVFNLPVHLVHDTFVLNVPVHLVHDICVKPTCISSS
jgi:hypothetical protein